MPVGTLVPMATLVSFLWAIPPITQKSIMTHVSMQTMMLISSITYFVCMIIYSAFFATTIKSDLAKLTSGKTLILVATTVVCTFASSLLYYHLLKGNEARHVTALTATTPMFTLFLAVLFLNGAITSYGVIGVLLIVIGAICISYDV